MNCVDLYVRKYPSDPDPSRSRKKKTTINTTYCRVLAIQANRTATKTSVRSFHLHKDVIRGETLAYPVVDDAHQHEPVR